MIRLFEELVIFVEQSKRMKRESMDSNLLFDIYNMTGPNRSEVFSKSATWVNPEHVDSLVEQGIIQRVASEDPEKYALTFKGIALSIKIKYGKNLEEQFLKFLQLSDKKFTTAEQTQLNWSEKLASLSLILVASISDSAAIRLNNEANKTVLNEVFEKTLGSLKKFGVVKREEKFKTYSRGEHPVSALMSRLNTLAQKTNHYYKNLSQESGYFFDIEKDGAIDERKLFFLLRRIFGYWDPNCDYGEMYRESAEISRIYSPRFLARSTNPTVSLSILKKLKDFMDKEILHLPQQPQPNLEARGTLAGEARDHKTKIKTTGDSEGLTSWIKE